MIYESKILQDELLYVEKDNEIYSSIFLTNNININLEPIFNEFKRIDRLILNKCKFYHEEFNKYSREYQKINNKLTRNARDYEQKANEAFSKFKFYREMLTKFRQDFLEIKNSENFNNDEKTIAFSTLYLSCDQIEQTIYAIEWKKDLIENRISYYPLGSFDSNINSMVKIKKNLETALEVTKMYIHTIEEEFEDVENYKKVLENYKKLEEALSLELTNCKLGKQIDISTILNLEEIASNSLNKYLGAIKKKSDNKQYYEENPFIKDIIYFFNEDKPWILDSVMVASSIALSIATKGAASKTVVVSLGILKAATTGYFIGTGLTDLAYEYYTDTATPYSIIKNTSRVLIPAASFLKTPSLTSNIGAVTSPNIWFKQIGVLSDSPMGEVLINASMVGSVGMQAGVLIDTGDIIIDAQQIGWTTQDVQKLISNGVLIGMSLIPYVEKYIRNQPQYSNHTEEFYVKITSKNLSNMNINFDGQENITIHFLNQQGVAISDLYIKNVFEDKIILSQSTRELGEFSIELNKKDFLSSLNLLNEYNILFDGDVGDLLLNYSRVSKDYSLSQFIEILVKNNLPVNVGGLLLSEEFNIPFNELSNTSEFYKVFGKMNKSDLFDADYVRMEGTNPVFYVTLPNGDQFFLKFDDSYVDNFCLGLAEMCGLPNYAVLTDQTQTFAFMQQAEGTTLKKCLTDRRIPTSDGEYILMEDFLKNDKLRESFNRNLGKVFAFEKFIELSDNHSGNYLVYIQGDECIIERIDYDGAFVSETHISEFLFNFNEFNEIYKSNLLDYQLIQEGFEEQWTFFQDSRTEIIEYSKVLESNKEMQNYLDRSLNPSTNQGVKNDILRKLKLSWRDSWDEFSLNWDGTKREWE